MVQVQQATTVRTRPLILPGTPRAHVIDAARPFDLRTAQVSQSVRTCTAGTADMLRSDGEIAQEAERGVIRVSAMYKDGLCHVYVTRHQLVQTDDGSLKAAREELFNSSLQNLPDQLCDRYPDAIGEAVFGAIGAEYLT